MFYVKSLQLETSKKMEIINISKFVEEAVRESKVRNGICLVHVPHATAGLVLNEDEPRLKGDILKLVQRLTRDEWAHNLIDDNAEAHLGSILLETTKVLPVVNGDLVRGTWQEILFVELDGPRRSRSVMIVVMGKD